MWNVVGHERAVAGLQTAIASGNLPHALLFTGPAGIGKERLALEVARAVQCESADPPCGVCYHCRQIEQGTHPDVTIVERQDGKESIVIVQVRALREDSTLRAFQARHKVYVISGAEALTAQAADALLKTLEEPQAQVLIILTATDLDGLPDTIVSRCRVVQLGSVPAMQIEAALRAEGVDEQTACRLARLAGGRIGWALTAARQPKLAAQQEELVATLSRLPDMSLDERLQLAETLAADRKNRAAVRQSIELLTLLARDLIRQVEGLTPQFAAGQDADRLRGQAARFDLAAAHSYLQSLRTAMARIDGNVDPRLALEALFVSVP